MSAMASFSANSQRIGMRKKTESTKGRRSWEKNLISDFFVKLQMCWYHVTFHLDLEVENTMDACSPGDHRAQVWSRSNHLPAKRTGGARVCNARGKRSPAAPPCTRSQLTRECRELPSVRMVRNPGQTWIWCILNVTEHLWWTDIESCKAFKWTHTGRNFPRNAAPWKVPRGVAIAPPPAPPRPAATGQRRWSGSHGFALPEA